MADKIDLIEQNKAKIFIGLLIFMLIVFFVIYIVYSSSQDSKRELAAKRQALELERSQQVEDIKNKSDSNHIDAKSIEIPIKENPLPSPLLDKTPIDTKACVDKSCVFTLKLEGRPAVEKNLLPSLSDSDSFAQEAILKLQPGLVSYLIDENLIRKFVVFTDNLASGNILRKEMPLKKLTSRFLVLETNGQVFFNPRNYSRYEIYVNLITSMDPKELIITYNKMHPLFLKAYAELGYADADFNNTVIKAIDNFLDAKIIDEPMELTTINVNYKYIDPNKESLNDIKKLVIRIGPNNAKKIQVYLGKLRLLLADPSRDADKQLEREKVVPIP